MQEIQYERPKSVFTWYNILLMIFGFGIIVAVVRFIGTNNIVLAFKSVRWYYLLAAVGLATLGNLLASFKQQLLISSFGRIKFWDMVHIYQTGLLLNSLTPGARTGGEFLKAFYVSKMTGRRYSESLGIVTLCSIVYAITFLSIAFASAAIVLLTVPVRFGLRAAFGAVVILFLASLASALWVYFKKGGVVDNRFVRAVHYLRFRIERRLSKKVKNMTWEEFRADGRSWITSFVDGFKQGAVNKSLLVKAFVVEIIGCVIYFAEVYAILLGFGAGLGFGAVVMITSVAMLVGYFMLIPGGIGVIESGMIYLYHQFGLSPAISAAVTLIDRLLYYVFAFGGGYISLILLGRKFTRPPIINERLEQKLQASAEKIAEGAELAKERIVETAEQAKEKIVESAEKIKESAEKLKEKLARKPGGGEEF